jgi:hypothetical protein
MGDASGILIVCGLAILCVLIYIAAMIEHNMKAVRRVKFVELFPDRMRNLHQNTEKVIDLSWYAKLVADLTDKENQEKDFDILSATARRVWKELGDERTLHITRGSVFCDN